MILPKDLSEPLKELKMTSKLTSTVIGAICQHLVRKTIDQLEEEDDEKILFRLQGKMQAYKEMKKLFEA
jgi:hypothetical protein